MYIPPPCPVKMSLITESDVYSPSMDSNGAYIDNIPNFNGHKQGLKCPCNNNLFCSRQSFKTHTNTSVHKNWLIQHNNNRQNYFQELEQAKQLIQEQKRIIAQLEREKNDLRRTIHILSTPTTITANIIDTHTVDLLEFD